MCDSMRAPLLKSGDWMYGGAMTQIIAPCHRCGLMNAEGCNRIKGQIGRLL